MDLGILVQTPGDDSISVRRIDVMENFVGSNSARRSGLVQAFVVIRHDLSVAE